MTISLGVLTISPNGTITATVTADAPGTTTLNIPISLAAVALSTPTGVTFTPSSASLFNNAVAGTVIAAIAVSMSDGSAFSGTLAASPTGIVTISNKNLVLVRSLTSADNGAHQFSVTATQNGGTASGSIAVQVNAPGPSFTVNGSTTPTPVRTGTNITIAVTGDPGGNYFRLLTPTGGEIQRTSPNTPPGSSQYTLPLTQQNIFQQQSPVSPGVYTIEYDQGGGNQPLPIKQIQLTVTS